MVNRDRLCFASLIFIMFASSCSTPGKTAIPPGQRGGQDDDASAESRATGPMVAPDNTAGLSQQETSDFNEIYALYTA